MSVTASSAVNYEVDVCMKCGWIGPLTPTGRMATRIERDSLSRRPGATIHDHACGCEPAASIQRDPSIPDVGQPPAQDKRCLNCDTLIGLVAYSAVYCSVACYDEHKDGRARAGEDG